jgi:hypothetical protein
VPQKISDPSPAELAWVDANLVKAREFVVAAGRQLEANEALSPDPLDAAWSFWLSRLQAGEDPNPAINALALAFGKYLLDRLQLSWKVVEDEYGTEVALHGQPNDVLIFPPNLVAKRFQSRTIKFFVPLAAEL